VRGLRIAISNPVPFSPETTGDVFCFFLPCLHLVSTANTKCKRPLWSGHGAATADGVQSLSPLRIIPFFLSSKPERAAPDDAMVRRPSIIYASHNFHARRHGTSLFPLARQCRRVQVLTLDSTRTRCQVSLAFPQRPYVGSSLKHLFLVPNSEEIRRVR
jgi:hypothetical protein